MTPAGRFRMVRTAPLEPIRRRQQPEAQSLDKWRDDRTEVASAAVGNDDGLCVRRERRRERGETGGQWTGTI